MEFELRKWRNSDADSVANIANNLRNVFLYQYTIEDAKWYVNSCVSNDEICQ